MAVTIIKATEETSRSGKDRSDGIAQLRVAAYARVSTDAEEQESSYEAQCTHYTHYITANPEWTLAGIYADSGISGTTTKHREQFNQLIADCQAGLIDMVITKSISRFARNTLDCLQYIRLLKSLDIPILFEKEGINTLDSKGEILITIMASIAQQESQSISENIKMGIQFRMQQGHGVLNPGAFLGFEKDSEGNLVIVPEEADIVRRIFREYLEGRSPLMIAERLTTEQIPSPRGGTQWHSNTIRSMLQNEKYAGDLLLQKYYTESFLTHKLVKNNGKYPKYLVENHHPPIVPKEIFNQVQWEIKRRGTASTKIRYGNTLALNNRLICGSCGQSLRRFVRKETNTYWRCRHGCLSVSESEAQAAAADALRRIRGYQDRVIYLYGQRSGDVRLIDFMLEQSEIETAAAEDSETHATQLEKEHELRCQRADLANQLVQVQVLLDLMKDSGNSPPSSDPSCSKPNDFFLRTAYHIPSSLLDDNDCIVGFDNDLIVRFVDSITVREHCFVVHFKGGVCINVRRKKYSHEQL